MLFLFLFFLVVEPRPRTNEEVAKSLTELVNPIEFKVDDVDETSGGWRTQITHIKCGNIKFESIDLQTDHISKTENQIHMKITKAEIDCTGKYHFQKTGFLINKLANFHGDFHGSSKGSTIDTTISMSGDDNGIPFQSEVSSCSCGCDFDCHFSKSLTSAMLETFRFIVKPIMNRKIKRMVCSSLTDMVRDQLSPILANARDRMTPYVTVGNDLQPAPAFVEYDNAIMWSEVQELDILQAQVNPGPHEGTNVYDVIKAAWDGSLEVDLDSTIIDLGDDGITQTKLVLHNVTATQLKTLEDIKLSYRVLEFPHYQNDFSLGVKLEIKNISLDAMGLVDLAPGKYIVSGNDRQKFHAGISVDVFDVHVHAIVNLPVDRTRAAQLSFGQLKYNLIPCMASAALDFNVTLLDVNIRDFADPQVRGFVGIAPLFNKILNLLSILYKETALKFLHGFMQNKVRDSLSLEVQKYVNQPECPPYIPHPGEQFTNFLQGTLGEAYYAISFILSKMSASKTHGSSDVRFDVTPLFKGKLSGGQFVGASIENVHVSGLEKASKLLPMSLSHIESEADLGDVSLQFDLLLNITGTAFNKGDGIFNHLRISLTMHQLHFAYAIRLLLRDNKFTKETIQHIMQCPLSMFDTIAIPYIHHNLSYVGFNLTCLECHSSSWQDWSDLLQTKEAQAAISDLILRTSQEQTDDEFFNGLNEYIDMEISEACVQKSARHSETQTIISLVSIIAIFAVAAALFAMELRKCVIERKKFIGPSWQRDSLMMSPCVPDWAKVAVPLICISGIVLFAVANVSIGAIVSVRVYLAGDEIYIPGVMQFSLQDSLIKMWKAGTYFLAFLIGGFSGFWPHMKLLLMLSCWVLPMTMKSRYKILWWLEFLGKWSLMDVYLIVVIRQSFNFEVESSEDLAWLPPGFLKLDMLFKVGWGITGFIYGTMISLITSNVVLYYHYLEEDIRGVAPSEKKEGLLSGLFTRLSWSSFWFLLCSVTLLCIGVYIDCLSLTFDGVASIALPSQTFSVMSFANGLWNEGYDETLLFLSVILFALFLPIFTLILLIAGFTFYKRLKPMIYDILLALSSVEVFFAAILAAYLEFPQFVGFILDDILGHDLKDSLAQFFSIVSPAGYHDILVIETGLPFGSFVLGASIVLWFVCVLVIGRNFIAPRGLDSEISHIMLDASSHEWSETSHKM